MLSVWIDRARTLMRDVYYIAGDFLRSKDWTQLFRARWRRVAAVAALAASFIVGVTVGSNYQKAKLLPPVAQECTPPPPCVCKEQQRTRRDRRDDWSSRPSHGGRGSY